MCETPWNASTAASEWVVEVILKSLKCGLNTFSVVCQKRVLLKERFI